MAVHVARRMMGEGVDVTGMEQTVKLVISGPSAGSVYRPELLKVLSEVCDSREIRGIWKTDKMNIWFVTCMTEEAAQSVVDMESVRMAGDRVVRAMWYNRQMFTLRVHWLAPFVRDRFVEEVFGEYGTVRSVTRDVVSVGTTMIETGVRRVKITVTDRQRRDLPHVVNFADGHAILVVCPGRNPVCLACGAEGHIRAWMGCPARQEKRSWTHVVRGIGGDGGGGGGTGAAGGVTGAAGRDTGGAGDVTGSAGSAGTMIPYCTCKTRN